jgi:flagellar protein FlaG
MVSEVTNNGSNSTVAQSKATNSSDATSATHASAGASSASGGAATPSVDMQKLHADLAASIEKINQSLQDGGRNLSFSVDPSIVGGPLVTVKNAKTGEVVRQIPNEAVVRVAHNIDELKGVLYNGLT